MKTEIEKLGKSELRKKQDSVLEKQKIFIPQFSVQQRIVGLNSKAILGVVLLGSFIVNWQLYKRVESLGADVEKMRTTSVSVEVKNSGMNLEEQQRYLDRKLGQLKQEIITSIQKKDEHQFQVQAIGERASFSRSLLPSAIELIEQIDIQQYTIADAEQFSNFRSLLGRLDRMRSKYRKEVQDIVSAYSKTHQISGVDSDEYYALLEKRKIAFDRLNSLHEEVKESWKLKNKVTLSL